MIKRIGDLIYKLVSVKGFVFGVATWLVYEGKLDSITWAIVAAGIIGTRAWEKQKVSARLDK